MADGRRFRRIRGGDGDIAGVVATRQVSRNSRRSFEAAMRHALEYNSSSDEGEAPSSQQAAGVAAALAAELAACSPGPGQALREKVAEKRKRKEDGETQSASSAKGFKELLTSKKSKDPEIGLGVGEDTPRPVRRRIVHKQNKSKVIDENTVPSQSGENISPEKDDSGRFRPRGGVAGIGQGGPAVGRGRPRGSGKADEDSGDEQEPDEEVVEGWSRDLAARQEPETNDLRTAFSMEPCSAQEIRRLSAESFLGGRKPEAGGKPLYNLAGKVSLQFLLATYRSVEKVREKHQRGEETSDLDSPADRSFLRWLVRKSRELQLLSRKEVRRGQLNTQRLEAAKKTGDYSLMKDSNLAEASDEEAQMKQKATAERTKSSQYAASAMQLDVEFPERRRPVRQDSDDGEAARQKLKSQAARKKDKIHASSSHGLDLLKMREVLTAPSLSFDWGEQAVEEEEEEHAGGVLEVDVPDKAQPSEDRRALWRVQMKRSVSFSQAKNLAKVDRSNSNGSLSSEAAASVPQSKRPDGKRQENADTKQPPPDGTAPAQSSDKSGVESAADEMADLPSPASPSQVDEGLLQSASADFDFLPGDVSTAAASPGPPDATEATPPENPPPADDTPTAADVEPSSSAACPTATEDKSLDDCVASGAKEDGQGYASDNAPTQDWPEAEDLGPTAVWGGPKDEEKGQPKPAVAACSQSAAPPLTEISPTLPFEAVVESKDEGDVEISPTLPFVPVLEPKPAGQPVESKDTGDVEISPTLPFVPVLEPKPAGQPVEGKDAGDVEISPTLPFVPVLEPKPAGQPVEAKDAGDVEISPTLPFVPVLEPKPAGQPAESKDTGDCEISPTMPFEAKVDPIREEPPAVEPTPAAPSRVPAAKRSAEEAELEDTASSEHEEEENTEQASQRSGLELSAEDRARLQREREWLRHKRRALRKETVLKSRQEDATTTKVQRKAERLDAAAMTSEDRERYTAVVTGKAGALARRPAAAAVPADEDDIMLGGRQRGGAGKRSFFMGGGAGVAGA